MYNYFMYFCRSHISGGNSVMFSALDYHSNGPRFESRPWQNWGKSAARHPARRPGVGYKPWLGGQYPCPCPGVLTSADGCRSGYTLQTIRAPNRPVGSKTVDTTEMGRLKFQTWQQGGRGGGGLHVDCWRAVSHAAIQRGKSRWLPWPPWCAG